METGGRWNEAKVTVLYLLAKFRVQPVPLVLRRSAQLAWMTRWSIMRAVAAQDSLAASVLAPATPGLVLDGSTADAPELDVLLDHHRV